MPATDERFRTARATLLVDRFMNGFIKVGGLAIIAAVFAIFVFILIQILPLFQGARVAPITEVRGAPAQALALGVDEWGELPVVLGADGALTFVPVAGGAPRVHPLPLAAEEKPTAADYDQRHQVLTVGTNRGRIIQTSFNYTNAAGGVVAAPETLAELTLGVAGTPILDLGYGEAAEARLAAVQQEVDGVRQVHAVRFRVARTMMGAGKIAEDWRRDCTSLLPPGTQRILVDERAEQIIALDGLGQVTMLKTDGDGVTLGQAPFRPFADLPDPRVSSLDFLLGDVSLVATAPTGANRIFSLFIDPVQQKRQYGHTKTFTDLHAGATAYAASSRNKAFVLADTTAQGSQVSLRYGTSETVRWEGDVPFPVTRAVLSGKYHRLLLLDSQGVIHAMSVDDPHPEAGIKAFFGTVWYEGADAPRHEWQSSGASDDFEPKLSLVPLIVGTLKGTIYAMLFAVPIALLAAVYTAEFMHPRLKLYVKPTVEIMASLPSVVLGFLAALWIAPRIEDRVPSVILVLAGLPVIAMGLGWAWTSFPSHVRSRLKPGYEFLAFIPVLLISLVVLWSLGPAFERLAFNGDFCSWWPRVTGAAFEQRNSLVVGFVMGFAVIPILFTIIEDSLSNVPKALRSGSLALGASRWQTAMRIVVPTASAGILSALMIGFGRAIGETMIVVMATGNTPIMDLNIFSGMRTLSANIAVELPEAPHHGTLYRTLFLGAMLLFLMTFVINTLAEVLRSHLREKYKTV